MNVCKDFFLHSCEFKFDLFTIHNIHLHFLCKLSLFTGFVKILVYDPKRQELHQEPNIWRYVTCWRDHWPIKRMIVTPAQAQQFLFSLKHFLLGRCDWWIVIKTHRVSVLYRIIDTCPLSSRFVKLNIFVLEGALNVVSTNTLTPGPGPGLGAGSWAGSRRASRSGSASSVTSTHPDLARELSSHPLVSSLHTTCPHKMCSSSLNCSYLHIHKGHCYALS